MSSLEFSQATRAAALERLARDTFDLVVVGGGINGAGIARDAAMRGMSVAVLEKDDFASGTSSRSTKLVHGGIRYLEHYAFGLVHEASIERALLLKTAPHLVKPLSFLMPVYRGSRHGPFLINLGLWLYDALALFRNVRNHENLGVADFERLAPGIRSGDLLGGPLFYDAQTDDARLTLENLRAAHARGAVIANRARVTEFLVAGGKLRGVAAEDSLDGGAFEIRGRVVVNATGPWSDAMRRLAQPGAPGHLRITKGVHILLPRQKLPLVHAVVIISPIDQRVLFAIPWEDTLLVGTTDTDFEGNLDELAAEPGEVDYLLETLVSYFPKLSIGRGDILSTYAGVRPLLAGPGANGGASAASREHKLLEESSGLLTLVGGKLTTFRKMAQQVVDRVGTILGSEHGLRMAEKCRTAELPLRSFTAEGPQRSTPSKGPEMSPETRERISGRYPGEEARLLELLKADPSLAEPLAPGSPHLGVEVAFACHHELALHLEDLMVRRLSLYYRETDQGLDAAARVAAIAAPILGWTTERVAQEQASYASVVAASRRFRA